MEFKNVTFARKASNIKSVVDPMNGAGKTRAVVTETKVLTKVEFEHLCNNLMDDQEWLPGAAKGDDGTYRNCILVKTPGAKFNLLIDSQGYDYPRYVAKVKAIGGK